MASDDERSYSPQWAPHVTGTYPPKEHDHATGGWAEQRIRLECSVCNDVHYATCSSGQPRTHVANYARVHLHRDGLSPLPAKRE